MAVYEGVPLVPSKAGLIERLTNHYKNQESAMYCNSNLEEEVPEPTPQLCYAHLSMGLAERAGLAANRDLLYHLLQSSDNGTVELDCFHKSFDVLSNALPGVTSEHIIVQMGKQTVPCYRQYRKHFDVITLVCPTTAVPAREVTPLSSISKADILVTYLTNSDYSGDVKPKSSADSSSGIELDLPPELLCKGTVELPLEWFVEHDMLEPLLTAFQKEFGCLRNKKTYRAVPRPPGAKLITSKVIYAIKLTPAGKLKRVKVRFVPRGFGGPRIPTLRKEQDVVTNEGLFLFLTLAAQNQWDLSTVDFETAFLQSEAYAAHEERPLLSWPYLPPSLPDGFREALGVQAGTVM